MEKGFLKETCSKCDLVKENIKKRYCNKCSAAYLRKWRKSNLLTAEQKFKALVRNKTGMRIKRGLLIPQPCEIYKTLKVEAHHDDYQKAYDIRWLCFKHHREYHKNIKLKAA